MSRMKRAVVLGGALAVALASPLTAVAGEGRTSALPVCDRTDPVQQNMTLRVPLDYNGPGGQQITLTVSRACTARPDLRRGVLLMLPGGPGKPSLNEPSTTGKKLPQEVRDRYDLVSFDPRGMGQSTPVSCELQPEDRALVSLRPWPAPDGDISANVAAARRTANACARDGGELLRSISTRTEARDMDRIRSALGEDTISYWGVSYGSYVGATYAAMFPWQTDRVLLDSNDDPNPRLVERGWLANAAVGTEDRFPGFAAYASTPGSPGWLAPTPDAVRATVLDVAAKLDRNPIDWLTGNVLRAHLQQFLQSDDSFPALSQLVKAGRGEIPLPNPPKPVPQDSTAVGVATLCNDVAWPRSVAEYAKDVQVNRVRFPLTAGMPVNVMPCAYWPSRPAEDPVTITPNGPSNVLLLQNLRDPVTPHSGALNMLRAFGDRARMVTVDSGGHGSYLANGKPCGDRAATDFLVTGRRPADDTLCQG